MFARSRVAIGVAHANGNNGGTDHKKQRDAPEGQFAPEYTAVNQMIRIWKRRHAHDFLSLRLSSKLGPHALPCKETARQT
jgi:hypothetical protein